MDGEGGLAVVIRLTGEGESARERARTSESVCEMPRRTVAGGPMQRWAVGGVVRDGRGNGHGQIQNPTVGGGWGDTRAPPPTVAFGVILPPVSQSPHTCTTHLQELDHTCKRQPTTVRDCPKNNKKIGAASETIQCARVSFQLHTAGGGGGVGTERSKTSLFGRGSRHTHLAHVQSF